MRTVVESAGEPMRLDIAKVPLEKTFVQNETNVFKNSKKYEQEAPKGNTKSTKCISCERQFPSFFFKTHGILK